LETLYYIILVPMVYVAFATFFIGTAVRLTQTAAVGIFDGLSHLHIAADYRSSGIVW
jgi:hypothetical protein